MRAEVADILAPLARALRPGGRLVVLDYCHYLGFLITPPMVEIVAAVGGPR